MNNKKMSDPSPGVAGNLYSGKSFLVAAIVSFAYLLLSFFIVGFKTDQLILVALFNSMYFISAITRKFILAFSVFIIYWIIFDYMKAFPNYQYNVVHIESLYDHEKNIFGIIVANKSFTPNEYLLIHQQMWLNVLTGFFYLCWVPLPLIFAGILFFKNRKYFFYFSLSFLLVNIIGFIIYYIYPAAPPWYVQQHGFDFIPSTPVILPAWEDLIIFFTPIFLPDYTVRAQMFLPQCHPCMLHTLCWYFFME